MAQIPVTVHTWPFGPPMRRVLGGQFVTWPGVVIIIDNL